MSAMVYVVPDVSFSDPVSCFVVNNRLPVAVDVPLPYENVSEDVPVGTIAPLILPSSPVVLLWTVPLITPLDVTNPLMVPVWPVDVVYVPFQFPASPLTVPPPHPATRARTRSREAARISFIARIGSDFLGSVRFLWTLSICVRSFATIKLTTSRRAELYVLIMGPSATDVKLGVRRIPSSTHELFDTNSCRGLQTRMQRRLGP